MIYIQVENGSQLSLEGMMKKHSNCRTGTLAQGENCRIDYCTCGLVHLHFGPFSLRLERDALPALGATVDAAVARIEKIREMTKPGLRLVTQAD